MKVDIVNPYGYCAGVLVAIKKAEEEKREHPEEDIYLLGMLVHNEEAVASLSRLGLHVIDERKVDLKEALKGLPNGSTVIFSAHGHPREYDDIAKSKHMKTIDATCVFVSQNEEDALTSIQNGRSVIYLGSAGHLETVGFLHNVKEAAFYNVKTKELEKGKIKEGVDNPIVYSQTTLSLSEVEEALQTLYPLFPNLEKGNLRCHSTSLRQEGIAKLPKEVEGVIVLGSKTSNNSMKLYELAKANGKDAFLCLNLDEVKQIDLTGYSRLALASGASTSRTTFFQVKKYLEGLNA